MLWRTALAAEFIKPYFCKVTFQGFATASRRVPIRSPQLKDILILETKSHQVYLPDKLHHSGTGLRMNPYIRPARDIYSWSRLTPLDAVKAVVMGQAGPLSLAFHRSNSPLPLVRTHHNVSQAHQPGYSSHLPMHFRTLLLCLVTDETAWITQEHLQTACERPQAPCLFPSHNRVGHLFPLPAPLFPRVADTFTTPFLKL